MMNSLTYKIVVSVCLIIFLGIFLRGEFLIETLTGFHKDNYDVYDLEYIHAHEKTVPIRILFAIVLLLSISTYLFVAFKAMRQNIAMNTHIFFHPKLHFTIGLLILIIVIRSIIIIRFSFNGILG